MLYLSKILYPNSLSSYKNEHNKVCVISRVPTASNVCVCESYYNSSFHSFDSVIKDFVEQ
jgi:hypothetical protein